MLCKIFLHGTSGYYFQIFHGNKNCLLQVKTPSCALLLLLLTEDLLPAGFPNIDMGPQLKVVERTRTATMLCAASGNPDPEITWYKDFLPIDPSASSGRIKQLRSGKGSPSITCSLLTLTLTFKLTFAWKSTRCFWQCRCFCDLEQMLLQCLLDSSIGSLCHFGHCVWCYNDLFLHV